MRIIGFSRTAMTLLAGAMCLLPMLLPSAAKAGITFTTIFSFGGTNGASPGTLVQGKDGKLYGTTLFGGPYNYGTVFRVSLDGTFTNLAWFDGTNGINANQGLVEGANGNFYGAAFNGGPPAYGSSGTLYKVTPDGVLTTLVAFNVTNGAYPRCSLILAPDGNIYGTTAQGGAGSAPPPLGGGGGTIFRISRDDAFTTMFNFDSANQMGWHPAAGLVAGRDGYLYGLTAEGGSTVIHRYGAGTAFKMSLQGDVTFFASLDHTNASAGLWPLVQASDGSFYGTSLNLNENNGNIFRVAADGSVTGVHPYLDTDGYFPRGLLLCPDGNFYGITGYNSVVDSYDPNNAGNIFTLTPDGKFTILFSFGGTNGSQPCCALMQASDGNLYGTTRVGGLHGGGTIFRLSVPFPAVVKSIGRTNNIVAVTWSSVASQKYQVQYRTGRSDVNWHNLGGIITATNGTMTTCDQAEPGSQRYYRVVLIP